MKYLRRHNVNPFNLLDDTILQQADGNIEFNPTSRIKINGDLEFGEGFSIPGPVVTNIMYVTLDGNDANDGFGEGANQAKRTIKAACAVAQEGTTIYVRSGEYYENNPIRVPPKVSIVGDNLRNTILRPLNGTLTFVIVGVERTDQIVTITTLSSHGLEPRDRVRIKAQIGAAVSAGSFVVGQQYTIVSSGDTDFTLIGSPSNVVGTTFTATGAGAGSGTAALAEVDETDINILEIIDSTSFTYRQPGSDIAYTPSTGTVKKGSDFFHVNSADYIAQLVIKGMQAPGYCVNIDSDAIVDTSPYIQNCSNINGPWMKNGVEWLPFQTEQPDLTGTMVVGPRPLRDDEIDPTQLDQYGIDVEGAGGGMLIDGDRYNTVSPILSMVADAFTQVAQGGVGFHITNFGYMQLVSCFAVFCSKGFYATRGGYLSVSNSVCDFGDKGFIADGYYPDAYNTGLVTSNYYSSVGSITVNVEGSGYTVAPSITIAPPTTPGGVQATAEASIDPILGIINAISITQAGSGYDFQPSITITPAQGGASATANLAKNLHIDVSQLANKPQVGSIMFLGSDPTAYYISSTAGTITSFKYNEQKCRRDVAIILNAVLTDAIFNSNHQTVYAGLSYLRSYSSKVTSLQKSQTIAGLQQAKTEALALTSNTTMQTKITANFNTVINIINLGSSVAPSVSNTLTTTREPGFAEAAAILVANKIFVQEEIAAWIAVNYPTLSYNVATCKRDIGYIVDALAYDMIYDGNSQTVIAALAYESGNVIAGQVNETQAAYEYWKTIAGKIARNQSIVRSVGNTTTQNIGLPLGSPLNPLEPAAKVETLLQIVVDVVDHGTGYVPNTPIQPNYGFANDPLLVIERENILDSSVDIQLAVIEYLNSTYGSTLEVSTFPAIQSVTAGTPARFHNVSTVSTASTAMEYVGAGVTYNALPFFGGEPIPVNERVELNSGKCFTVTSDQIGNYRIGQYFNVNSLTGEVTIDAENINLSGIASIGPFRRNGIPVGEQLREVSNNSNLVSSTGSPDPNTVPTQVAVQAYVENRYLNKVTTNAQTLASSQLTITGDIGVNGGDIYSTATTFNLANRDNVGSITDNGPTTANAFLNATAVAIGASTGTTTINHNLAINGSIVETNQLTVNLLNTVPTTMNFAGAATALSMGATTGTATVKNSTITFPNATAFNINGASPTLASTSTGTLTLFDTLITTVNAFRAATTINIGETSGTLNIKSANAVLDGDLQVKGGDVTTNQTTFNLLNTTATTVNAFGAATALNLGGGSGTTTIANNLKANISSTLGSDTTSANVFNGTLTANIRDNTTSSLNITESTNSYIKIDTNNSTEAITFGTVPKLVVSNVLDASSTSVASATFAGGVGIAKKLYVGTDLNVAGSTTLGDDRTVDVHAINGTLVNNVPDNTAIAFQVKENTQTYLTAVTTDGSESITIESTPKLLVKNTTDSSDKDTGALIVEGGVGIEKNLSVGVDFRVGRDVTITGDLSVNGGDLLTTAATFNLVNTNATTVNFAGAATTLEIGAATGTTNINNNLDVDGDVNIDGGDLTVSTATFNLANTTATTLNFGGAGTTFNLGTSAGAATTVNIGSSSRTGNTVEINSTAAGTINLTTDVTSGTVNEWQSVTGTINIGSTGNINLGTGTAATTTAAIGGAITGNTLKISSTAVGTANLSSDVTSGTVNVFAGTTGTLNIGGQGSIINLGATGSNSILEVRGSSTSGTTTIRTNSGVVTADVFNTVVTTGNLFGAGTTVSIGAATGTTTINNANTVVTGDLAVNGGDVTTSATTFNLLNTTVTTGNLFGAGTAITIGAITGTTTIRNANTVVTGDLAVNGGDITSSATTFNLLNTTATTVNFAGAATTLEIGAATGLTRVKNNFEVDGDVTIDGGDLIVSTATFNLANTSATTVNFAGAATTLEIGAATGTTNINNNLDVDGDVNIDGGDLTVSTSTFNIANTTATTVNAFGAATSLVFAAATGTTNIRNNLDVDGDINVDGGDITTSAGTFNLANTTATTVNAFGAATGITIGFASPTGLTTIRHDLKVDGDLQVDGTLTLGNDVTISGDLAVNGGDLTTTAATFNLINANATTVNFAGAGTAVTIGSTTGTTTIRNANTVVTGDLAVNGGDITSSAVTVNILAATSTTVNAFGAATALNLGAATGTTIVRNNFEVDLSATINGSLTVDVNATVTGDLAVNGGDVTTSATTFNLINANATTVNFAGAGTAIAIGAATGTTNIKNNLDVDGDVNIDGGDLTVSTSSFNLANTTATTVSFAGAATALGMGAATGTLTIGNPTITGTNATAFNMNGASPSIVTTSTGTGSVFNTNVLTGNLFGAATAVNIGNATGATLTLRPGTVVGSNSSQDLYNTVATTMNFAGASTSLNMGAATGTMTIGMPTITGTTATTFNMNGASPSIVTSSTGTASVFNTNALTGNLFGTATAVNIGNATSATITLRPGTLVGSNTTQNVYNTTATTVNAFGAATVINVGTTTGTLTLNNPTVVGSQTSVNLWNTTSTTVNAFGAATTISIGAATGTTTINNANTVVTGDLAVNGGDVTTSATTFNLLNTTATTVNFAGAATTLEIGAATGTTNINNNLDVDGDVNIDGGDLTVSTATFNLANTTATTVNFAGAATTLEIGAATGTTNINNNLDVDGDVNIDGGDLTVSTTTFNLANTTATTGNLFGVATGVNVGISAASASTLTYGPAITGNTFKLAGTTVGTINYTTDVTSGTVNAWQSVTGIVNLGKSGTINIGNSTTATTAAVVGGAFTGNSLKIASTTAGAVTLNSDVTTGSVSLFNNLTTGTLNVAGAGASTINLGSATSTVNIGVLTLATDLAVQYGGTGQSSFTTNGVIYGQNASGLAVTAASVPGSNATTSYGVLTTDVSNVPVWTDTIDGGSY